MERLGAREWQIGLSRLLLSLGFTLPAILAARQIHGLSHHKSFLVISCVIGRAGLLTLPPVILLLGRDSPGVTLAWFLIIWAIFWACDGGAAVSWFDIVAKTIPSRIRGRFFGAMQMLMGAAALAAGLAVSRILRPGAAPFPQNFAILAALWCAGAAVSQIAILLIREPAGNVEAEERPSLAEYLRRAPGMMKRHPRVGRLIAARVLLDGAGMAAPFYVLFAERDLNLSIAMVGVFTLLQSAGKIAFGPFWGWVSGRFGAEWGLRGVAAAVLTAPLLALAATRVHALILCVFVLLGAVQDGLWMAGSNVLLESVGDRERPMAVGIYSVFQLPSAIFALVGGLIAESTSYGALFGVALGFGAGGLWACARVSGAPRHPA